MAVAAPESMGLRHESLTQKVFEALALPLDCLRQRSRTRFQAEGRHRQGVPRRARLPAYRDLKRGWRITLPNLEQCGLLEIRYQSLDELCEAEEEWQGTPPGPVRPAPGDRG